MNTPADPAHRYADIDTLSRDLAAQIASSLTAAIERRGLASLVVSGGQSQRALFEALRTQALDWKRVCVALADERWVDAKEALSNERQVREALLQDRAVSARFLGLKNGAPTPDLGAVSAWETFARVPRPFDAVLLGVGKDGHTASLYRGAPNLARALNPAAVAGCVGMWAPEPPQARLSLNLTALLDARRVILLIGGEGEWHGYRAARAPGPWEDMPVRGLLHQHRTPVDVFWSP